LTLQAIIQDDRSGIFILGQKTIERGNVGAGILALDRYFLSMPYQDMDIAELLEDLHVFRVYAQEIAKIISHPDPVRDVEVLKLCGIRHSMDIDNEYRIAPNSLLSQSLSLRTEDNAISSSKIREEIYKSLSLRLQRAIQEQEEILRGASHISPCVSNTVYGKCWRGPGCPDLHAPATVISAAYTSRAIAHFEQIAILQVLHSSCFRCTHEDRLFHRK
jgi:hypothetical protein